jgi:putative transposase
MIFNRKIQIQFTKEVQLILDGQSKICNWLYNHLLEMVNQEYKGHPEQAVLLNGRNLRNQVPIIKKTHLFLNAVYSSPLKNVAFRLKQVFDDFFKSKGEKGHPKFKSNKVRWFSLFYDEPNKGYKLVGKQLLLSLGIDKNNTRIRVMGTCCEDLKLKEDDQLKNFRLCKEHGKYYGIFCIERTDRIRSEVKSWISIDPNHKNFFVGINHKGESIEFEKIRVNQHFDSKIDELKSKRDHCKKYSNKWKRRNQALNRLYHRRREQIKSLCFTVANYLAKNYDQVVIGDYTPSLVTANQKNMHRSMLNQSIIGHFRRVCEWVLLKSGKHYLEINEHNTTKACCICHHLEKKNPTIRDFICTNCQRQLSRDINSSVNIAKKANLLSGSDYDTWDLSQVTYTAKWNYRRCNIKFAGYVTQKVA